MVELERTQMQEASGLEAGGFWLMEQKQGMVGREEVISRFNCLPGCISIRGPLHSPDSLCILLLAEGDWGGSGDLANGTRC